MTAVILLILFLISRRAVPVGNFDTQSYPESLVKLLDRNPETAQFVRNYPKYKDRHDPIDLSQEVVKGEIPLFLQWDERWGYETYGNDFLAVTGCGPTCLSMVYCGLSGDSTWNPYRMASMAENSGYYVKGAGSAWDLMESGAASLGLTVHGMSPDAQSIQDTLLAGMPIICSVGPGDFTSEGHFIVLAGTAADGKIKVLDPNSRKNSEKRWDVEVLLAQIRGLWAYSFDV
ncbi:MAG: papain-like cysteine protease family protein [Eubacteriales bacterium]|nr:papain-like cysteine protease family protein [Eubacteriales bacterium]